MSPWKMALLVAGKELRELSRDLRTVVMLVLIPALLYPLLLGSMTFFTARGHSAVEARPFHVEVSPDVPQSFVDAIAKIKGASIAKGAGKRVQARVVVGLDGTVVIESEQASELGQSAAERLQQALLTTSRNEHALRLLSFDVPADELLPRAVETIDVSPDERRSGFLLSRLLVPLLMTILMVGSFYPAIDMTSGERERSTLQTLLCAPIPPAAIAAGKLITVTMVGLSAALANVMGLALTASVGLSAVGDLNITFPWSTIPLVIVVLVPFALYVSAILMAFGAMTKSVREAQTTLTPVFMVLVLPVVAAILPGSVASWKVALIPIYGPSIALREIFAGSASVDIIVAAVVGAMVTIVVGVAGASRAFTVDALMTGKVEAPRRVAGPLPTFDALLLVIAMVTAYFVVGAQAVHLDVLGGTALLLVVVFALIPALFALARSTTPRVALGLVAPRTGFIDVVGVLMIAPTVAAGGEWIAHRVAATDSEMIERLRDMAERMGERPAWLLALVFVVVPALCEEMAFRGALLRALTRRHVWLGLLVTSILFALAHGALARMPITFGVGMFAGYAALRMNSVVGGMLVHLAHNGTALLVASWIGQKGGETAIELQSIDPAAMETTEVFLALPWFVFALCPVGIALCAFAWRSRPGFSATWDASGQN